MASLASPLPRPGGFGAWWLAARPRTLPAAAAPVAVGTAVAVADGAGATLPALGAMVGAVLLQIGTNLANDVFDFEKGADTEKRLGPPRAAQLGLLSPRALRSGMLVVFGTSVVVGVYLAFVGGWPIVALGLLSIAAGVAYTGGPYPLGYHGWGDLAVFLFFGLAAVCGSYWVQALALPIRVVAAAVPIGALATAILVVNNLRDIATDAAAGKRTLAVRLGRRGVRIEFLLLIFVAYAACPMLWWVDAGSAWLWLPWASLPLAIRLVTRVWREEGPSLNEVLTRTAQLELLFASLLAIGWLL